MNFYEHQKQNTTLAGTMATEAQDDITKLTGKLLLVIAAHPSLMESTYEYNEDIQNAVNELADTIIRRETIGHE